MQFDIKHVISLVVGAVLAFTGAYFGLDFSKSCPPQINPIIAVPGK